MENIKDLQKNIKKIIKQLGLSQIVVSHRIFMELNEHSDDENEIEKFTATFKKHLNRDTTKPEILESYLGIIGSFTEFKKADLVVPNKLSLGFINDEVRSFLTLDSKKWLIENRAEPKDFL